MSHTLLKILALSFFWYIMFPLSLKFVFRQKILSAIRDSRNVCLTFDDGPHPESTPLILGLLKAAHAKATFFLLGANMEKYPDLVTRIIDEGHDIGEHSYEHMHPWACSPIQSIRDQLRAYYYLKGFPYRPEPVLFRPPYGKLNLFICLYILFFRRLPVFWSINAKDYEQKSPDTIFEFIKERLYPGEVVLLHDGRIHQDHASDVSTTIAVLKSILQESKSRGLRLATISESLNKKASMEITCRQ